MKNIKSDYVGTGMIAYLRLLAFGCAVSLSILIIARSVILPITIDEVTTLLAAKELTLDDMWSDANFHPLNSLWVNFAWKFSVKNLWIFRLPNVVAGLLYIVIAYKASRQVALDQWPCYWILFMGNPFAIEFFSLARGYGIALCFATAAIYAFLNAQRQMCFYCSCLSVLSNYSFSVVIFPIIFLEALRISPKSLSSFIRLPYLWVSFVAISIVIIISFKLKSLGLLYFGGRTNFFGSTLKSIVDTFCYNSPYSIVLRWAALFSIGCVLAYSVIKAAHCILNRVILSPSLLVMTAFSFSLCLAFNGTFHVVERTALGYWVLLVFCFVEFHSKCMIFRSNVMIFTSIAFSTAIALHTISSTAKMTSYNWGWDLSSGEVAGALKREAEKRCGLEVAVCSVMIPALNFNFQGLSEPRPSIHFIPAEEVLALPDPNFDLMSGEYYGFNILNYPSEILKAEYMKRYLDAYNADAFYLFDDFQWPWNFELEGYMITRFPKSKTVLLIREGATENWRNGNGRGA